jgi:membrane-associated protease RseP (regulator of RpoE activity)
MTDVDTPRSASRGPAPRPRAGTSEGQRPGSSFGLVALVGLVVLAGFSGGWSLLAMIGAIVGMIFLHELGHYLTAKWAGMKVTEFFIGFGPRIWSFRKGETEYGVKVIPAGAYVKIVGMHNLDEYDPADVDRTYLSKPFWRRLSVAVAGSAMHFLLALVGLFALFGFLGLPGGGIADPQWVVAPTIAPDSPAAGGGVEPGDRIISVDGVAVDSFTDFTEVVRARPGEVVPVTVVRDGDVASLQVELADVHPTTRERVGFFGVGPAYPEQTVGAVDAVGESFSEFGDITVETVKGLGRILSPSGLADLGSRVFTGEDAEPSGEGGSGGLPRQQDDDANRPISVIGVTQIGSELLATDASRWLALFVVLNVFIGVFNLVPLLPLDGGHVAIATYEKVRSMFQGGRPYHVDVAKLLPLTYAVVFVLVFVGLSTMFLDIADPVGG